MRAVLVERYGCRLSLNGAEYTGFPEPPELLAAADNDLLPILGSNQRKVEYLQAVAQAFASVDE